jgi:hypothetical protein
MNRAVGVIAVLALTFSMTAAGGTGIPGTFGVSPDQPRRYPPPRLRDVTARVVATITLNPSDRVTATSARFGDLPTRIGTVHEITNAPMISDAEQGVGAAASSRWSWHGSVSVPGAQRLRLRIESLSLSADTVMWVYGSSGEAIGFDLSLRGGTELWTPSVDGDTITLELDSARGGSLRLTGVAVIDVSAVQPAGTECFRDVACQSQSVLNDASAVARYEYVSGGSAYLCSGALILDEKGTFTPYFLTAGHCISTGAEAASVDAYWDYRAPSCGSAFPPLSSLPRTHGATLLVTSSVTDVTLLRLTSVPGNRYYLGWNTATLPTGTRLHRISHPLGVGQAYTEMVVDQTVLPCIDAPRGPFIYTLNTLGGVTGGSSGAPAIYGDGQIVGQLLGGCPKGADPCDTSVRIIDGNLRQSFPLLQPYLAPNDTQQCNACVPSATTACVLGNRFQMTVNWATYLGTKATGTGKIIKYTENRPDIHPQYGPLNENVFFSLFDGAPNSVEVIVRMFKGAGINNKYWVAITGLTNVEYTVTVIDTTTCQKWEHTNPWTQTTIYSDQNAFPFP